MVFPRGITTDRYDEVNGAGNKILDLLIKCQRRETRFEVVEKRKIKVEYFYEKMNDTYIFVTFYGKYESRKE